MATNVPHCGLCKAVDILKTSVVWCFECESGLCSDCEKRHKAVKTTKSHQTISIDKHHRLPSEILKISQICPDHNERFHSYCGIHECPCCVDCIIKSHKECKTLTPIQEIVSGIKTSNVLRECEESLSEIQENISSIIRDRQHNLSSLKTERKRIESEIRETKRKVIRHIDTIEEDLLRQLGKLEDSENSKIRSLILSLEQNEKEINGMKLDLAAIKEHASELQTFMAMKNVERMSSEKQTIIEKLCSDGSLENSHLSKELDKTLKTIEKSIPTFGRVSLESRSLTVVLKKKKDKQAQLHVPNVRTIDSIGLDLIRSIDVKRNYLYGCCFLPDGRYAVASYQESCIVVMKEDGTIDFEIDVKPYNIADITHIPSTNTLAATTGGRRAGGVGECCINIINIDTRRIDKSIPTDTADYGIQYRDGNLIYCAKNVGICQIDLKDGKKSTIKSNLSLSSFSYVASHRHHLYYTNREAHTVTCCSMNGTIVWEFKDENILRNPEGISVDNNGNVFVLGCGTHNLVILSADGSRHSELLSRKDGLRYPVAVDYDQTRDRLLLTNDKHDEGKMFLYKLK